MDRPKKILVCRTDRIGDFILSLPFADELKKAFPEAKVYWLIAPVNKPFMDLTDANDGFFVYDKRALKKGRALFSFARQLRKQGFDTAIALNPNLRLHMLLFLAGIRNRLGWRAKGAGMLLTKTIEHTKAQGLMHEAQYNMLFLPLLGVTKWSRPVPRLKQPGEGNIAQRMRVAVHTGASCPSKRWPVDRFVEVVKGLFKRRVEVVLIGDKNEKESAQRILREAGQSGPVEDMTGIGLKDTIRVLSECDVIISNDSGPAHIAAALGLGCVVIFGRNDPGLSPQRWAPLCENKAVLHKAQCDVCLAHKCRKGFECLKNITVDDVLFAFDSVFTGAEIKRRLKKDASKLG